MSLLARLLRLYALALACGVLYLAPRSAGAGLPAPVRRRRLWEVWPAAHDRQSRCAACGRAKWGEDLGVVPLLWGGSIMVCDACLAREVAP